MDETLVALAALTASALVGALTARLARRPAFGPVSGPAAATTADRSVPDARAGGPAATGAPAAAAPSAAAPVVDEPATPKAETPGPTEVQRLRRGLATTRGGFVDRLARLFGKGDGEGALDDATLEEVEEILLGADLGVKTADRLLESLRARAKTGDLDDPWAVLREEALGILGGDTGGVRLQDDGPALILVVGVNGVGKTTTIGKLGAHLRDGGRSVLLAAGDTFRAAAIPQLESWGRRIEAPVVAKGEGADPGSVIFDAVRTAKEKQVDVVIADTAGRLHTKTPLMEELKKVHRTSVKALDGREPDELLLVLDATTGQNAVQQARLFKDALPLTGVVLTKLDGTAKGGVVLAVADEHGLPVRYVGIGERVEDLREFDPASFVAALFEKPGDETLAA